MRQRLTRDEWDELSKHQHHEFYKVIGDRDGYGLWPSIGELIEFLHKTGYDWEIGFRKKTFNPTGEVEFERSIFRVRIAEEGLIFRGKELIEAVFSCVKGVLKSEL